MRAMYEQLEEIEVVKELSDEKLRKSKAEYKKHEDELEERASSRTPPHSSPAVGGHLGRPQKY